MNQDLTQYCQVYNNYFDPNYCKNILQSLEKVEWGLHRYFTSEGDYVSTETDLSVSYDEIPESNNLHQATWHAIKHYQETLNFSWFKSWHGMTSIRFNRYDQNTNMMPHCDHIHSLFDGERKGIPVLSIVGVLNNDYEGGEFVMWEDKKIELPAGSIMIFPSNFLYPHQVTPIIKGTRYSFVQWVW
jgi:predicted 2-oxoglutarate/Fe(II)-dependent dioxygenase YbiX